MAHIQNPDFDINKAKIISDIVGTQGWANNKNMLLTMLRNMDERDKRETGLGEEMQRIIDGEERNGFTWDVMARILEGEWMTQEELLALDDEAKVLLKLKYA